MAYGQIYEAGDVGKVSIDLIVGLGAFFVSFVALVALVILWTYMRKGKFALK